MTTHPVYFYSSDYYPSDFRPLLDACNRILESTNKRLEFADLRSVWRWPAERDTLRHADGWPFHVRVQADGYYSGECPEGTRICAPLDPIKLLHEAGHAWGLGWAEIYKAFGQVDNTGTKPKQNCSRVTKPLCGCAKRNKHWFGTIMCGNGERLLEYEKRILNAQCQRGDILTMVSPEDKVTVLVTDASKEPVDGAEVDVYRWVQYGQSPKLAYWLSTSKRGEAVFEWGGDPIEVQNDAMRLIRVEYEGRVVKDWVHVMECVESRWLLKRWQVEVTV